jgi:hypothetical protein
VLKKARKYAKRDTERERLGQIQQTDTDKLYAYAEAFVKKVFPARNFAPGGMEKLVNVFGEMAQK